MSVRQIAPGATDQSIVIRIIDSTDGTPETAVTSATTGLDLWYRREGAASVDITESNLSALTDAHSDGGMLHINDGYYRVDYPDAAFAAGVAGVQIGGTATGMIVLAPYVELRTDITNYDPPTKAELDSGLAALNDLDAAGVRSAVGLASANLDTQLSAIDTVVDGIQTDLDNGTDGLGAIKADTAAILIDTNELQTDDVPGLIAALNDLDAAGIRTAVGLASANLDTQLDALPTAAENRAEMDSNSTQLAAIVADTNELQTDDVPGLIAALNDPTAAAVADAVWDEARSGHTTAGTFGESFNGVVNGEAATGTLSTTQMTTNLTEATDDHYNGRIVVFITGVLAGQATDITDYTGSTKLITMTALTEAPSNGDRFVIV